MFKEFWRLPQMDDNEPVLEDDGELLQLMIAGEERGFVALYRKYQTRCQVRAISWIRRKRLPASF